MNYGLVVLLASAITVSIHGMQDERGKKVAALKTAATQEKTPPKKKATQCIPQSIPLYAYGSGDLASDHFDFLVSTCSTCSEHADDSSSISSSSLDDFEYLRFENSSDEENN